MPIYSGAGMLSGYQLSMRDSWIRLFPIMAALFLVATMLPRLWIQTATIVLLAVFVDIAFTLCDGARFYFPGVLIALVVFFALTSTVRAALRRLLPNVMWSGLTRPLIRIAALLIAALTLTPVYVSLSSHFRGRNWLYRDAARVLHLPTTTGSFVMRASAATKIGQAAHLTSNARLALTMTVEHLPLGEFPSYPPAGAIFTPEGAGSLVWVTRMGTPDELALVQWSPQTGDVRLSPLPGGLESELEQRLLSRQKSCVNRVAPECVGVPPVNTYNSPELVPFATSAQGLLFYPDSAWQNFRNIPFLTKDGKLLSVRLMTPDNPSVRVLPDGSILVYGGMPWVRGTPQGVSEAIQRVWVSGDNIHVEAIPAPPERGLRNYELVGLPDGRLMALGGSTGDARDCKTCVATTYFLKPGAKQWDAGPNLLEPRSDLRAMVLPDDSVLVVGGHVPVTDAPQMPPETRQVLKWTPQSDRFTPVAPMVVSLSSPQVQLLGGTAGPDLVVSSNASAVKFYGDAPAVELYDLSHDSWVLLNSSSRGRAYVLPYAGQLHAWILDTNLYNPWGASRAWLSWTFVPLPLGRPDAAQPVRIGGSDQIVLQSDDFSFASPTAAGPALAVGGAVYGRAVGVADALWPDGRITTLPTLNFARRRAYALTLGDGSRLVVGGTMRAGDLPSGDSGSDAAFDSKTKSGSDLDAPPAEWLSAQSPQSGSNWVVLNDPVMRSPLAVGQTPSGDALILGRDGAVHIVHAFSIPNSKNIPHFDEHSLPPVSNCPGWDARLSGPVSIRGLADGRIIVAGGEIPVRIAVWQADSDKPGTADRYIDTGEHAPWSHYCIYDSHQDRWSESASVLSSDAQSAILDDGRVLVAGPDFVADTGDAYGDLSEGYPPATEVSAPAGSSWRQLAAEWSPSMHLYHPKLFELQGEVFLCGQEHEVSGIAGNVPIVLQWFDQRALIWQTIWQSPPGGSQTAPPTRLILLRDLDGKRVMVPACER